jgi:hypothetical protein
LSLDKCAAFVNPGAELLVGEFVFPGFDVPRLEGQGEMGETGETRETGEEFDFLKHKIPAFNGTELKFS